MSAKPVLVVMAAGMGSRYGGLKQLDALGPNGQTLMDYSLYDAWRAGFSKAVFVINEKMARDGFESAMRRRLAGRMQVRCAVQRLADVPSGFARRRGGKSPGERPMPCGRAASWWMRRLRPSMQTTIMVPRASGLFALSLARHRRMRIAWWDTSCAKRSRQTAASRAACVMWTEMVFCAP